MELAKEAPSKESEGTKSSVDGAIDDLLAQLKQFEATNSPKEITLKCLRCNSPLKGTEGSCPNCHAELTGRAFACPNCHESLSKEDRVCPSCHLELRPRPPPVTVLPPVAPAPSGRVKERKLRSVMKAVAPKPERLCPGCGMPAVTGPASCPYCGTDLSGPPKPIPSTVVPTPAPKAPAPSQGLRSRAKKAASVVSTPQIVTPAPVKSQTSKRGLSNGVGETNGTSFVNGRKKSGITNGTSSVNGRKTGATNGASFVNGKKKQTGSFVNGTGVSNGLKHGKRPALPGGLGGVLGNWKFLSVLVALVVVIPTFVYISSSHERSPYRIDGVFTDWSDSVIHGPRNTSGSPSTSLRQWSVEVVDRSVYFYARMGSNLMSGQAVESVIVYIDSDESNSTGYTLGDLGADYMIEADGWNGSIGSASLFRFASNDRSDWNGWQSAGQALGAVKGAQIEASAELPTDLSPGAKFLLVTQDSRERHSISYEVPSHGGLLIVRQIVPANITSSGLVPSGPGKHLLTLEVSCEGVGGTVMNITPVLSGASLTSPISGLSLSIGETKIIDIIADVDAEAGRTVSARVLPSGVVSDFEAVQIIGDDCTAYADSPPAKIVIDGAFADWQGKTTGHASNSTGPENVRIDAVGAANDTASDFFYVSVEDQMCSGTYVPAIRSKPSGSGPVQIIPHRLTAEDEMRILIDSDTNPTTGMQVVTDRGVIGADHLISVRGIYGRIVNVTQSIWLSGSWNVGDNHAVAANDYHQMEVGVESSSLGTAGTVEFAIMTTSWRGVEDTATAQMQPDPWAMRGAGADYRSADGATWAAGSTITLTGGDTVVDMAPSTARDYVYAITNSGRVYSWQIGVSSAWSTNITDIVNGTANVVAIAPYDRGSAQAGYALASDGRYWKIQTLGGGKAWAWGGKVADGITDFTDIDYQKTGADFYVIRTTANTPVYWAPASSMAWSTTAATGSPAGQTHIVHVGASRQINERVIVLCQNGKIRDSSDGGATWTALGNLPVPQGSGNASTVYIGMDFDPSGFLWVITDNGWCWKSSDTSTYASFACTGRATTLGGIVALTCPIPEIGHAVVPVVLTMCFAIIICLRGTARRRYGPERNGLSQLPQENADDVPLAEPGTE